MGQGKGSEADLGLMWIRPGSRFGPQLRSLEQLRWSERQSRESDLDPPQKPAQKTHAQFRAGLQADLQAGLQAGLRAGMQAGLQLCV